MKKLRFLSDTLRITLVLVANGYTNPQIARIRGMTLCGVTSQMRRIMRALKARDRAHAVARGLRFGEITVDDVQVPVPVPGRESA